MGEEIEVDTLKEMLESYNLEVPSIIVSMSYLKGTGSPWVFTSPDSRVRKRTVKGFKEFIRLAHGLEAKSVCVASIRGRIGLDVPRDKAIGWAIDSVKECNEFAQELGIILTVKSLNRFEIDFVNTNEECNEFIDAIGSDNIYILADVYHMNIEEASIAGSIRKFGKHLYHFYVCDSNRLAPGR